MTILPLASGSGRMSDRDLEQMNPQVVNALTDHAGRNNQRPRQWKLLMKAMPDDCLAALRAR
jgi:hypothetical protein